MEIQFNEDELLVKKWKTKTNLLKNIPPHLELEYSRVLEKEAKIFIDKYKGRKNTAPNIWPDIERKFLSCWVSG